MTKRIEWDARFLDEHGDAFDVRHFDRKDDATREAAGFASRGAAAAVVERHDLHRDYVMRDTGSAFTLYSEHGCRDAIARWKGDE